MVITHSDYENLQSQIEQIKIRAENLPETFNILSERLMTATKVNPMDMPTDVVTMNSFVKINWMNTGVIRTVNLVYPDFENSREWRISVFSSLGAALIGQSQGNEIIYRIRKRDFRVKIMSVVFQPEAFGNYAFKR